MKALKFRKINTLKAHLTKLHLPTMAVQPSLPLQIRPLKI